MLYNLIDSAVYRILNENPMCVSLTLTFTEDQIEVLKRRYAKERFDLQLSSITDGHPDDPLYGRGPLWYYEPVVTETDSDDLPTYYFAINHSRRPTPSMRSLILLASISEEPILCESYSSANFRTTKRRMLDKTRRNALPKHIRARIETIQLVTKDGRLHLASVNLDQLVKTTHQQPEAH